MHSCRIVNEQVPDISAPDWVCIHVGTQILCDQLDHGWVLGELPSITTLVSGITLVDDADSVSWTLVSEGEDMCG